MEKARKRLRVCLICIVLAAIVVGMFYYYSDVKGNNRISEGTLITSIKAGMDHLWQ